MKNETKKTEKKETKKKSTTKEIATNAKKEVVKEFKEMVKNNDEKVSFDIKNIPFKTIGIIASVLIVIFLIFFIVGKENNKETVYQLSDVLNNEKYTDYSISLPKNLYFSDNGELYSLADNNMLKFIANISAMDGSEDDFKSIVESSKLYYENVTEDEINEFKTLTIVYDYEEMGYTLVFMYKNETILQLMFENAEPETVLDIASRIK